MEQLNQTHENFIESESAPPISLGSATSSMRNAKKRNVLLGVLGIAALATLVIVSRFNVSLIGGLLAGFAFLLMVLRPGSITRNDDAPTKVYVKNLAIEFGGIVGILVGLYLMLLLIDFWYIIALVTLGIYVIIRVIKNNYAEKHSIPMRRYPPLQQK